MTIGNEQKGTGHTDRLVDLALGTRYSDIPRDVAHDTKRVILDTIGCSVAGFATDAGRILVEVKRGLGGREDATLMVHGGKLPVTTISYIHAQLGNALDLDETLIHRTHYANSIVMPALAMAEMTGASGQEMIAAVALGFDIGARVGFSMPQYETTPEGIVHFVPVMGFSWAVFGTVATAGRLLGLSHQQMANALSIAYVSTPVHHQGRWRKLPGATGGGRPMHKYAMYGAIAEAGINAVLLAAEGFTGDPLILDSNRAFWTAFSSFPADWDYMVRDLGQHWFISETSLKFYPAGRQASIPVDLFLKMIQKEGLSADEIEEVTVTVPPAHVAMGLYDNTSLPSQLGPMPIPIAFAIAALGIESGLQWVSHETLRRPEIRAFALKVKSAVNQDWYSIIVDQVKAEGTYRRIPTEVEIKARGTSFKAFAEYARGDPWGPEPMTDEDLAYKFGNYTSDLIGRANADRAITEGFNLEAAPDVRKLVSALHR
ncbi:MAG: MmgE/PrpD family protein [Dehalococcoidia bacterium]|nr:MmgE/PrpD family protein [Dehalococcoidia bacterium]